MPFQGLISTIELSHDKKLLAVGASTATNGTAEIVLYDTGNWFEFNRLSFHEKSVFALRFSNDDQKLISIGNFLENILVVWDLKQGLVLRSSVVATTVLDCNVDPSKSDTL